MREQRAATWNWIAGFCHRQQRLSFAHKSKLSQRKLSRTHEIVDNCFAVHRTFNAGKSKSKFFFQLVWSRCLEMSGSQTIQLADKQTFHKLRLQCFWRELKRASW